MTDSPRDSSPAPALDSWSGAGALRGAREILPIALSVFVSGLVCGVLAKQAGLSTAEIGLMSLLLYSGALQFAALGIWAMPLPVASLLATAVPLNLRHLLLGAVLRPLFTKFSNRQVYPSLLLLADENWALSLSRFKRGERDGAFLLGSGMVMWIAWVSSTMIGHRAGALIGNPARFALDFTFTLVFAALLTTMFRGKRDLLPWAVAAVAAIAADRLLPGNWYIILGGLAGCAAGMMHRER